ncbi:PqiC family protein [Pseudomonas sp. MWU16-30317]|uniref:PqiC family protein n=1 Tax=Pseudomonas sp. MWU16-30317 TaxID=2878095 RepID=UPI001CFB1033|nr:PqiC family protein [Pseudomonas sp. MWU16-30317]
MMLRYLLLGTTLGLAACTSPATHYYTLVPTTESAPKAVTPADFQFELLTVRMPVQVDQPQLVVRQDQGRLAILDNERWGAPLADEFHDALAAQMERQLGVRDLSGLPKNAGQPVVSLQADVRRFDSVPGQYALVDVVWSLSRRGNDDSKRTTLTCATVVKDNAGVDLNSLVLAHQKAIGDLAARIAGTARQWADNPAVGCPQ